MRCSNQWSFRDTKVDFWQARRWCQCQRHYFGKSRQDGGLATLNSQGSPVFMVWKEERQTFYAPCIIIPAHRNIYYWPINSSALGKKSFYAPGINFLVNRSNYYLTSVKIPWVYILWQFCSDRGREGKREFFCARNKLFSQQERIYWPITNFHEFFWNQH